MAKTTGGVLFGKSPVDGSIIRLGCIRSIQKPSTERSRDTELCIDDPEVLNSLPGNELTVGDLTITLRDDNLPNVEVWCDWLYDGDAEPDPDLPECLRYLTCLAFGTPDGRACFMPGWLVSETENQRTRTGDCTVTFVFAVNSPPKKNQFRWDGGGTPTADQEPFILPMEDYFENIATQSAAAGQPVKVGQIVDPAQQQFDTDIADLAKAKESGEITKKEHDEGVKAAKAALTEAQKAKSEAA